MKNEDLFDRFQIKYLPVAQRKNKVRIERDCVKEDEWETHLSPEAEKEIPRVAAELKAAKERGSSRMCVFGAHAIKNGLGPLLGKFVQEGWFTHLATNGAGIIHDWEFSFLGESSEDVRANVQEGHFGTWEETGLCINLAIVAGAYEGLGYGESVGRMIAQDGFSIPSEEQLEKEICDRSLPLWKRAAAADFLDEISSLGLEGGRFYPVVHPYKKYSIQAACWKEGIPFTDHPMIGHDIIYTHKANKCAAIGRAAERDFLRYAKSVENLEGGVYLSIGSAVMSPMIFEKSMSMSRNVLLREGKDIRHCHLHVVDLQKSTWDWSKGEPPMDNPAYYLRYMKTFSRMGCPVDYLSADNRDYLVALWRALHD